MTSPPFSCSWSAETSITVYANRVAFAGKSARLYCYPAFIKLRWRDGEPLDAKAYLVAGTT
ncbi:MAG: hypothetical protein U0J70_03215 [Atopobiaceae bacterium]|nr:hypothetical protein [Atopobiaceae bacterium]